MISFRFIQFILLASFSVFDVNALASRQIPSAGVSAATDPASMGGYLYGESALFGGSASYSTSNLWAGRKAQAQAQQNDESKKESPSFLSAFVPNTFNNRDSTFTQQSQK